MRTPRRDDVADAPRLWLVALAPPLLWVSHFTVTYALAELSCLALFDEIVSIPLATSAILFITLVTEGLMVLNGLASYRLWRGTYDASQQYRAFAGILGFTGSIVFGITVLTAGLAPLGVAPCL